MHTYILNDVQVYVFVCVYVFYDACFCYYRLRHMAIRSYIIASIDYVAIAASSFCINACILSVFP